MLGLPVALELGSRQIQGQVGLVLSNSDVWRTGDIRRMTTRTF